MRAAAFALLALLGMAASGAVLAGKSFSGTVGAAVPSAPAAAAPGPSRGHYHHHRTFVGAGVGFGYPWGWWYPPPYYYYYPVPAESVTYIEQGDASPEAERWWYYCESSTSYYPYVRECPAGWERVAPR
jgi:hypothetical protein